MAASEFLNFSASVINSDDVAICEKRDVTISKSFQDNSIEWFASSLVKCNLWLRKSQKAELENFLSQLPSESAVQTATTESQAALGDSDDEYSECGEFEHEVQTQQTKKPSRRRMETDEDGWTTIVRR